MTLDATELTWLGHATFLVETPEDDTILVDPWLEGNPKCPDPFHDVETDAMLITHGHADHVSDVFDAQTRCDGDIVGIFEMCEWLKANGVDDSTLQPMNKGGTIALEAVDAEVTMTDAHHSSSFVEEDGELIYLGEPAGYVLHLSDDSSIYFAGDTCLFGDMRLIGELYDPDVAVLPIGDRFTMDPEAAGYACELLDVEATIPCHWGTFPALTGTPEAFAEAVDDRELDTSVVALEPGESWTG